MVEGVDDYWFLTELSNLFARSGEAGLPEDLFVTPAGGASEAAYIATFMIGQKLDVVVLLDSDKAGEDAKDALVKKWLTRYPESTARVLMIGPAMGMQGESMVEDLFPEDFYLKHVGAVYGKQIAAKGVTFALVGSGPTVKRVERYFKDNAISFNKGSVATAIRHNLLKMKVVAELPPVTKTRATELFAAIRKSLPMGTVPSTSFPAGA